METIWHPSVTLELLRENCRGTAAENLGIQLTELGADFLTGTMPVDQRTCQPMKLLHGGASVALAETLGSLAANAAGKATDRVYVGQEINANHLRPARVGETVTGTARPFHVGKTSQVWGIEILNERGQRVCIARITMAAVPRLKSPA